jgi:predicted transcriptional regulator
MANWTLITNHAGVLLYIAQHPRSTAREIAATVGITERATRKIIADLDEARFIAKKKEGRRISYTINHDAKLRRENVQDIAVGKFLEALGWQKVIIEVKPPAIAGPVEIPLVSLYKSPGLKEHLVDEFYSNLF